LKKEDSNREYTNLLKESIKKVREYVPGKDIEYVRRKYGLQRVVKLASNENSYGPSPKAVEAFCSFKDLHLYPPPRPESLLEKISSYTGFDPERIVLGAGIDGVLENLFRMFIEQGDRVLIPAPTFPYYYTLATISGARIVEAGRNDDFSVDSSISAFDGKLVILCSPNNPTGNTEKYDTAREIAESIRGILFVDEAYVEFSSRDLLSLGDLDNVVIARTFSKAFGLANLRIGYAVVPEWMKKEYMKVNTPFPLSTPSIKAAEAALDDLEYMKETVKKIVGERERVSKELKAMGVAVFPSEANFILIRLKMRSKEFCEKMMRRGVIVRDCSTFSGCKDGDIRVSIGKREENDIFLNAVGEVLR
jgi:histidinol-phosphate aminotransferase